MKISINHIYHIIKERRKINKLDLSECSFSLDGEDVYLPKVVTDYFMLSALSPIDFFTDNYIWDNIHVDIKSCFVDKIKKREKNIIIKKRDENDSEYEVGDIYKLQFDDDVERFIFVRVMACELSFGSDLITAELLGNAISFLDDINSYKGETTIIVFELLEGEEDERKTYKKWKEKLLPLQQCKI